MLTTRENWQRIKQAIRDKYAWPGGYPLFIVMSDGEAMSIDAARKNYKLICAAYVAKDNRSGWYAIAPDINWEDTDLYCCDSGNRIESAYGEDEIEESEK